MKWLDFVFELNRYQILREITVTFVMISLSRSPSSKYSRTLSGVLHNFSQVPSIRAMQYPVSAKHTPYASPFQTNTGSPPRIMHSLNSDMRFTHERKKRLKTAMLLLFVISMTGISHVRRAMYSHEKDTSQRIMRSNM